MQPAPTIEKPAPKEHFVTKGEEAFNYRNYNDYGYKLNVAGGIAMIYGAERSSVGRKSIQWCADKLAGLLNVNAKSTHYYLTKTMFLMGGFAVMPLMKWMEDRKVDWIHKKNQEIYGPAADDPVIIQSEKEVAEAPKTSWASLISSRLLAVSGFYFLVGQVWDNKSLLSRLTNKHFKGKTKKDLDVLADQDPIRFAEISGDGLYIDRAIVFCSRMIGKGWSKITGNTKSLEKTEELAQQFPGMMMQGDITNPLRETTSTSLAYYVISELITSKFTAFWLEVLNGIIKPWFHSGKNLQSEKPLQQNVPLNNENDHQGINAQGRTQKTAEPGTKVTAATGAHVGTQQAVLKERRA